MEADRPHSDIRQVRQVVGDAAVQYMHKLLLEDGQEIPCDSWVCYVSDRSTSIPDAAACILALASSSRCALTSSLIRSATSFGSPTMHWMYFTRSVRVSGSTSLAAAFAFISRYTSPGCCIKIAWLKSTKNFFLRGCSALICRPIRSIRCMASSRVLKTAFQSCEAVA